MQSEYNACVKELNMEFDHLTQDEEWMDLYDKDFEMRQEYHDIRVTIFFPINFEGKRLDIRSNCGFQFLW